MRRLLVRYGLAMTSVVLVAFLIPIGLLARTLAQERAVTDGGQDSQSVAVFAGGAAQDTARLQAAVVAVNDGRRRTTVYLPDGTSVGPDAVASAGVRLAAQGHALTARTDGGVEVLVPVSGQAGTAVVRTFVPDALLTQGVARSWLILAGVGLLLLLGTAVAGGRVATRLSRSVLDLAGVAERLGAGDLSARVEPSGPPEVASVGVVLNDLGDRVSGLLANERELVADLSHRLRTPITALRLDADGLADPQDRDRMAQHVDELVAAVDAVVWAARHPVHDVATARCDAAGVVRSRAAFWGILATDQARPLGLDVPGHDVTVGVSAAELGAALDVLVDNVFSHTAPGTGFRLAVVERADGVDVVVEDDGTGLDAPELSARGRSGAGSTGLGLDVARRTAERAGGTIAVGAGSSGGARIVMTFPRAS